MDHASSTGTTSSTLDRAQLTADLLQTYRDAAESVVPWFIGQMGPGYFQDTTPDEVRSHLQAIIAAKTSGRPLNMTLRNKDGSVITAIRPGDSTGVLAAVVAELPMDLSLRSARIHSALDGSLVIDTFEFGERTPHDPRNPAQASRLDAAIQYAAQHFREWTPEAMRTYAQGCSGDYVLTVSPLRFCRQRKMVLQVSGTDGAAIELEPESDPTQSRITIAYANARTRTMLERTAIVLSRAGISIVRAYLDVVKDPPHGSVTMLGFVVQTADGRAIDPSSASWQRTARDLMRVKWIDHRILEIQARHPALDLDRAEALSAFAALVHQKLSPQNPFAFHRDRVLSVLEQFQSISVAAVDAFMRRFDPAGARDDGAFLKALEALDAEAAQKADGETTLTILRTTLEAMKATLRTNCHVADRFGFALRLDPAFMVGTTRPETPFGTFFVHGRGFNGFHVRFKEIARGGLRVVRPTTQAQYEREVDRLYDEVYGLAFAQQLKNKDIPEGGAKCAILLEVPADTNRCVKAFVDCILDLITSAPAVRGRVVDRLGFQEFIYLGPDENITPEHIEWIVARARRRGYALPSAFMSSKPGAGINHKVYGVTSEGVNVFLACSLRARGIEPTKQPFTVKITGGPDGDVAGNMMRILERDYGANARIVGVADGSGCGEDPDGLDHAELLRLFHDGLPIARFNTAKLGPKGRIVPVEAPDGAQLRNTMHNRVVADAFVPGGGRPATINERNWKDYLLADGRPSSPIIVEGANLFLTPEARVRLSEKGCLIMKDSSANKCGVITSSYEIQASMLLEEAEFMKLKDAFVDQVLVKLREFARREAELLLTEGRRHPSVPLPELSTKLSKAMNAAADAVYASMGSWTAEDKAAMREVILEHVPDVLAKAVGERLFTVLPAPYQAWMVAKSLSSRIVYREGIDFFSSIDSNAVGAVVLGYLRKEKQIEQLIAAVRASGQPFADQAASLLAKAGTRAALMDL